MRGILRIYKSECPWAIDYIGMFNFASAIFYNDFKPNCDNVIINLRFFRVGHYFLLSFEQLTNRLFKTSKAHEQIHDLV